MTYPDFQARAELYLGSDWHTASAQGARTFRTAAQAIRFALEQAAPVSLRGARLQIGDRIFSGAEIARLRHSPHYPVPHSRAGQHLRFGRRSGMAMSSCSVRRAAPRLG